MILNFGRIFYHPFSDTSTHSHVQTNNVLLVEDSIIDRTQITLMRMGKLAHIKPLIYPKLSNCINLPKGRNDAQFRAHITSSSLTLQHLQQFHRFVHVQTHGWNSWCWGLLHDVNRHQPFATSPVVFYHLLQKYCRMYFYNVTTLVLVQTLHSYHSLYDTSTPSHVLTFS